MKMAETAISSVTWLWPRARGPQADITSETRTKTIMDNRMAATRCVSICKTLRLRYQPMPPAPKKPTDRCRAERDIPRIDSNSRERDTHLREYAVDHDRKFTGAGRANGFDRSHVDAFDLFCEQLAGKTDTETLSGARTPANMPKPIIVTNRIAQIVS